MSQGPLDVLQCANSAVWTCLKMADAIEGKLSTLLSEFSSFKKQNITEVCARLKKLKEVQRIRALESEQVGGIHESNKANVKPNTGLEPTSVPPVKNILTFRGPTDNQSESWRQDFESNKDSVSKLRLQKSREL